MTKKFFIKLLFFTLPFLAAVLAELFVLPADFFTFRVWEALMNQHHDSELPGPFYPNRHIKRMEVGDLGHHTPHAVPKKVEWFTDAFGFRYRNLLGGDPDIVVIGDSNIVGSSLAQEDTLSEVLQKATGLNVYPFAPKGVYQYFQESRFLARPPKRVILVLIERNLMDLPALEEEPRLRRPVQNRSLQECLILLDRIGKANMFHFLRAHLRRRFGGTEKAVLFFEEGGFFLQGEEANKPVPEDVVEASAQTILSYADAFAEKGIPFLFVSIPNKETVRYRTFPVHPKPVFLETLHRRLTEMGVHTVPTHKAFRRAFEKRGLPLYQFDDTHWNPDGVRLAARLIQKKI